MEEREYLKTVFLHDRVMLTFMLQEEYFAAETYYIKRIVGYTKATRVPGTPEYFRGLLNIRGLIVPVIDLAKKFSLDELSGKVCSVIILDFSDRQLGFLTERVIEIIQPQEKEIQMASLNIPEKLSLSNIKGIVNMQEQSYFILDIEELFQEIFLR